MQQLQKNSYEFGFITNTNVWQNAVEKKFVDFSSFSDTIIRSNEVGMIKTEPTIFRLAIKRLDREDILFIDDGLANIKTAKSVGIESIQVKKNTPNLKRELKKAGITVA